LFPPHLFSLLHDIAFVMGVEGHEAISWSSMITLP
jgi:hypothetical protein